MTLIDKIEQFMLSDDENRQRQEHYLVKAFDESFDSESIDHFCIALCGYSFTTIREGE